MNIEHKPGKNVGHLMLYTLTTCPWCKKTKKLLDDLGVEYHYLDVDLLEGKEQDEALEVIKKWNPACSFPTLVINEKTCIVGFKENEIKQALKLS